MDRNPRQIGRWSMTDPTFPTDERSQTVPSFTVLRYKFSRVSDSFRERSRGKRFQNVFYLHHRYDRWNVSRSATGWKKRGDRFERCGNICGTRPTIIGTFPLTETGNEGHMARRKGTIKEISPILRNPLPFFYFVSRPSFHRIIRIYIYTYSMRICFSPSFATIGIFS